MLVLGVGEMLSMVCKMVRLSRKGAVHGEPRSPLRTVTDDWAQLSTFATWTTRLTKPLSISHQGQFPAITISFNLAQGRSLGTATETIQRAARELSLPPSLQTTFQGNAQAFQQSLSTVPLLIGAALIVVYLILGILYESYIHPLTILSTLPSAGAEVLVALGGDREVDEHLANHHQTANQNQLATYNQIANQHFQNGPVHHTR